MRAFHYFLICGTVTFGVLSLPTFSVYPSEENESKFLKSYDPVPVVNSLGLACYADGRPADKPTDVSSGTSNSAGSSLWFARHPVEHSKTIEPSYCADAAKNAILFTTLEGNILQSLRNAGCTAPDARMTEEKGIRIKYGCGRTVGTITAVATKIGDGPLTEYRRLSVEIVEQWMP